MPADALTLTVPNERRFFGVVRLLVGGLAARLDLPYEQMDDLQLAIESVLLRDGHPGEEITLELEIHERTVAMRIGPLDAAALEHDLADRGDGLGLQRLLTTLVDSVELVEREGREWLILEKRVPLVGLS